MNRKDANVNGFWIAGIAINIVGLAVVVAWALKAWRQAGDGRKRHDSSE